MKTLILIMVMGVTTTYAQPGAKPEDHKKVPVNVEFLLVMGALTGVLLTRKPKLAFLKRKVLYYMEKYGPRIAVFCMLMFSGVLIILTRFNKMELGAITGLTAIVFIVAVYQSHKRNQRRRQATERMQQEKEAALLYECYVRDARKFREWLSNHKSIQW